VSGLERSVNAVTDVVAAVLSTTGSFESVEPVVVALLAVLGGDAVGLYRQDRDGWTAPLWVAPYDRWAQIPVGRIPTSEAARLQPGVGHCFRTRQRRPFAITDLVTEREWQQSELAALMRPDWGRAYQFVLPSYPAGDLSTCWAWVIARERRNFRSADRDLGAAVLPVLEAVSRHHWVSMRFAELSSTDTTVLTQRELLVVRLLAEGQRARGIARQLGISPRTVHKHLERLYRKLEVNDRFHAVQVATDLGLVTRRAAVRQPEPRG
jgi:DNA-binding CsgD family transcriptional regulator